jgi:hypothetical protein
VINRGRLTREDVFAVITEAGAMQTPLRAESEALGDRPGRPAPALNGQIGKGVLGRPGWSVRCHRCSRSGQSNRARRYSWSSPEGSAIGATGGATGWVTGGVTGGVTDCLTVIENEGVVTKLSQSMRRIVMLEYVPKSW